MVQVASGSQDMTVPTVPDGCMQEVSGGQGKADTAGKRDILGASTSGGRTTLTAGDNRGILVRRGRKGKGQPLFKVRDIAAQFRRMASNASNANQNRK